MFPKNFYFLKNKIQKQNLFLLEQNPWTILYGDLESHSISTYARRWTPCVMMYSLCLQINNIVASLALLHQHIQGLKSTVTKTRTWILNRQCGVSSMDSRSILVLILKKNCSVNQNP